MNSSEITDFLSAFNFSGDLESDVFRILKNFGKGSTYHHLQSVTNKSLEIASNYNVDKKCIHDAAIMHDISSIIPSNLRLQFSYDLGICEIGNDDKANPVMLHGKISAEIAQRYFGIKDIETLNAMRYHTTLRRDATLIEQIVFIADKIALDPTETHNAEYLSSVLEVVSSDVTKACWYYLKWMFENLEELGWQKHYEAFTAYSWLRSIYED